MNFQSKAYNPEIFLEPSHSRYCRPEEVQQDSVTTSSPAPFIAPEEKISEHPKSMDAIFILLVFCFVITSQIFNKRGKMLYFMLRGLFSQKERKSIFFEATGNESYSKLLLCLQTSIILSIFAFCCFTQNIKAEEIPLSNVLLMVGGGILLFILFFLYKWATYSFIGKIFFSKETLAQWLDNHTSVVCLTGIVLFVPTLLMFFIPSIFSFCYFFVIFCFFIIAIIIIYKTYVLFFHNLSLLLYLFLYLCAQEIIPLFILYKGLIYLFNVVEKITLWL